MVGVDVVENQLGTYEKTIAVWNIDVSRSASFATELTKLTFVNATCHEWLPRVFREFDESLIDALVGRTGCER